MAKSKEEQEQEIRVNFRELVFDVMVPFFVDEDGNESRWLRYMSRDRPDDCLGDLASFLDCAVCDEELDIKRIRKVFSTGNRGAPLKMVPVSEELRRSEGFYLPREWWPLDQVCYTLRKNHWSLDRIARTFRKEQHEKDDRLARDQVSANIASYEKRVRLPKPPPKKRKEEPRREEAAKPRKSEFFL